MFSFIKGVNINRSEHYYLIYSTIIQISRVVYHISKLEFSNSLFFLLIYNSIIIIFQIAVLLTNLKKNLKNKHFLTLILFLSLSNHLTLILTKNNSNLVFFDGLETGFLFFFIKNILKQMKNFLFLILPSLVYLILNIYYNNNDEIDKSNLAFYIILPFFESAFIKNIENKKSKNPNSNKNIEIKKQLSSGKFSKSSITMKSVDYNSQKSELLNSNPKELSTPPSLFKIDKLNILDSLREGIVVFDEKLKVCYYNDFTKQLFLNENNNDLENILFELKEDEKYTNFCQFQNIPDDNLNIFLDLFNKKIEDISSKSDSITKELMKSKSNVVMSETHIKKNRVSIPYFSYKTLMTSFSNNLNNILKETVERKTTDYTLKYLDITYKTNNFCLNDNMYHYLQLIKRKSKSKLISLKDYLKKIIKFSKKSKFTSSQLNISMVDYNNYIMIAKANENNKILLIDFQTDNDKSKDQSDVIITLRNISENNFLSNSYENFEFNKKFISTLCHELKTPLNSITNMIDLIRENLDTNNEDEEIIDYTNNLIINSKFMLNTVNDFLDFFYLKSNNFQSELNFFNLEIMMIDICKTFLILANKKGLDLILDYEAGASSNIMNDECRIRQIIFNLLNNSIRFTSKGTIYISVKNHDSNNLIISIQDSGIGISDDEIKYLANLSSPLKTEKQTAGFGLIISNLLANYLGNCEDIEYGIHVSSEVDKGSKFWFYLENYDKNESSQFQEDGTYIKVNSVKPNVAEINDNLRNYEDLHCFSAKFMPSFTKNISLKSPKKNYNNDLQEISEVMEENIDKNCNCPIAMAVDDNPFNLIVCEELLKKFNILCEFANNGIEAIEKIKIMLQSPKYFCNKCKFYRMIFMDIDMPQKNGYETTIEINQLLKQYDKKINCKIIALSAFNEKLYIDKAFEAGMFDYIAKPLSKQKLGHILTNHFSELEYLWRNVDY